MEPHNNFKSITQFLFFINTPFLYVGLIYFCAEEFGVELMKYIDAIVTITAGVFIFKNLEENEGWGFFRLLLSIALLASGIGAAMMLGNM